MRHGGACCYGFSVYRYAQLYEVLDSSKEDKNHQLLMYLFPNVIAINHWHSHQTKHSQGHVLHTPRDDGKQSQHQRLKRATTDAAQSCHCRSISFIRDLLSDLV